MGITTGKYSITETDCLFIDTGATEAAETDVFGGSVTIYSMHFFHNHSNPAYVKIYNATTATVGTTDPDIILKADGTSTNNGHTYWTIVDGLSLTNMTYAAEDSSGTTGTAAPDSGAGVKIDMVVR